MADNRPEILQATLPTQKQQRSFEKCIAMAHTMSAGKVAFLGNTQQLRTRQNHASVCRVPVVVRAQQESQVCFFSVSNSYTAQIGESQAWPAKSRVAAKRSALPDLLDSKNDFKICSSLGNFIFVNEVLPHVLTSGQPQNSVPAYCLV